MSSTSSQNPTFDGSYELMHFTENKALRPVIEGTRLTANFKNGQLSGNGGLDNYGGVYSTDKLLPPSQLSISELTSTKLNDSPEVLAQQNRFFNGLRAATDIDYGDGTMTLSWDNTQNSLVFHRVGA